MEPSTSLDLTGLKPFQVEHAQHLARCLYLNRGALDASDTGLGKSFVASWIARTFKTVPLVVCPLSVKPDWGRAMAAMGAQAEIVNYERARGHKKKGQKLSSSEWGYEQAVGKGSRWVWRNRYKLVLFDEADRCGGMTSLNSKMMIAAVRQADHVLAMSATAAEDPRQLKALGFALRLFTLDRFKWWLLEHGCKPGVFGGFDFLGNSKSEKSQAEGRAAMLKIHKAIFNGGKGSRMRKAEIPDFPKTQILQKLISDESGKAAKRAEELKEAFGGSYDLGTLVALRQELELLKVPLLFELAEHYAKTSRVIIFVNYTETAERLRALIKKVYGMDRVVINGENSEEERDEIKLAIQANKIPVAVANVQAGGVGVGFHDPTGEVERTTLVPPLYSARVLEQVFGRVPRVGGAFSTQLLVGFADTLEEDIIHAVLNKRGNLQALNDAVLHGHLL